MILRASLMGDSRFDEFLAEVEVESDTPEKFGEGIRRTIVGTVKRRGPIWDAYMTTWQSFGRKQHEDGRVYFMGNMLQIEYDFYGFHAAINLEGDTIRIRLVERYYDGSLEEYNQKVRERNARVQAYHDKWDNYQVTRNDMREIEGLNPLARPFGDGVLSKKDTDEMRKLVWHKTVMAGLSRNTIV
jgi:uncharacterized protein with von Willebrand factor type A (vWA) domain